MAPIISPTADKPMLREAPVPPLYYVSDSIRLNTDISGYVYVYNDRDEEQVFYEDVLMTTPPILVSPMNEYYYLDFFGLIVVVDFKGDYPVPSQIPS